ncbi:LOW QUALITY PROTEIN: hypothetical protein PHMEG_00031292 [Phytophthora megakarya]|uniref:Transposase n=1 Tax=Phytophthora megakarya TaxID=4795 RepID=A0A225UYM8_9STRA|nr:LOW QUALITY PROTEIN: hypothetical protein PHMEG_00031292 [Phytophthora megakarya]
MCSNVAALLAPRRVQSARGQRLTVQEVAELVLAVPLYQRQTQRAVSAASGILRTTLHRFLADGSLRRASSQVKPTLTPAHNTKCLQWALAYIGIPLVHVDEERLHFYKETTTYYFTAAEQLSYSCCPNKKYIGKVMFVGSGGKTPLRISRNQHFDGKLGIWLIVEQKEAVRTSISRPKGTVINKSVSMTRKLYRKFLIDMVSLKSELSYQLHISYLNIIKCLIFILEYVQGSTVFVQQDNAGPHVLENDDEMEEVVKLEVWNIKMRCQPPRSPDVNMLDLGYFSSNKALQYKNA